jgi:hypothetical protein
MKALRDIYFFNAMGLATELRNGTISEARAVKHLIAGIIIGGVGFEVPISVEFQESISGFSRLASYAVIFVIAGVISYYGVWLTHQVNSRGDGEDYFLRFAALALPVGIQLVVLFFAVGLILVILAILLTLQLGVFGAYLAEASFYLAIIAFTAMFFLRMRKYIAVASGVDE